mmetsp:Transcript_4606/g.3875  ORF Transcript_4606/g.3875 Transcript_4606/m.3875 type:complete len:148 (-) Transcript_4606:39-482(-)
MVKNEKIQRKIELHQKEIMDDIEKEHPISINTLGVKMVKQDRKIWKKRSSRIKEEIKEERVEDKPKIKEERFEDKSEIKLLDQIEEDQQMEYQEKIQQLTLVNANLHEKNQLLNRKLKGLRKLKPRNDNSLERHVYAILLTISLLIL